MRKAFERQLRLDCPSVTNVPLNLHCRHETVPILHALQHVYSRPAVRDSILRAIARDVNGRSNARRGRPGIESAIGALQSGNALERCRDRTERGFARYIGLGVLGRNLHVLGKLLRAREAPDCQAAQSRRQRAA